MQVPAFVDGMPLRDGLLHLEIGDALLPILGREDNADILAHDLVLGPTQNLGGADIPFDDATVEIGRDDGIVRRAREDRAIERGVVEIGGIGGGPPEISPPTARNRSRICSISRASSCSLSRSRSRSVCSGISSPRRALEDQRGGDPVPEQ